MFDFLNSLKLSGGGPERSQPKYLKYEENKNNVLFLKVFWKWFLSINRTGMLLSWMVHLVNEMDYSDFWTFVINLYKVIQKIRARITEQKEHSCDVDDKVS